MPLRIERPGDRVRYAKQRSGEDARRRGQRANPQTCRFHLREQKFLMDDRQRMGDHQQDDGITIPGENFMFLQLSVELSALKDYWNTIEQQLPNLEEVATNRLYQEWLGPNADEQEIEMVGSSVALFTQYELPRMFRSTVLVMLWAIFESTARQVAEALRIKKGFALKAKDIKGKDDLDSLNKYFVHVLQFPLVETNEEFNRLDELRILRNAISHSNSRIDEDFRDKKKEDWKKIKGWADAGRGLSVDMGYLDFSRDFIELALATVGESIDKLKARALGVLQ